MLKRALSSYVDEIKIALLNNVTPYYEKKFQLQYSRCFYKNYVYSQVGNIQASLFLEKFRLPFDMSEETVFSRRICMEQEMKLKEFNFKLLHNILPCNSNLKKWKIRDSDSCDICNMDHTVMHLLFDCKHVFYIWNKVNIALGWTVEQYNIICGSTSENYKLDNIVITAISFFIYKEWLISSLENRKRSALLSTAYLKHELNLRIEIYKKCNMSDNVIQLSKILCML